VPDTVTINPIPDDDTPKLARLGILISGRGTNCLAIAHAIREGHLTGCEIAVVVCNVPGALGIDAARRLGLPVVTLEGRGREQRDHEEAISALLRKFRVDLVCMAGYRRVLSAGFVRQWKGRILNIHPSLLPAFPGREAVQQALDFGARFTGCTIFFVDEQVDGGVIVVQRVVEIDDFDTEHSLHERVLNAQHQSYPEAIQRVLSGEYEAHGRRYALREDLLDTEEEEGHNAPSETATYEAR
jgi:phosphoribosylglycinamide formyltransferase 1